MFGCWHSIYCNMMGSLFLWKNVIVSNQLKLMNEIVIKFFFYHFNIRTFIQQGKEWIMKSNIFLFYESFHAEAWKFHFILPYLCNPFDITWWFDNLIALFYPASILGGNWTTIVGTKITRAHLPLFF